VTYELQRLELKQVDESVILRRLHDVDINTSDTSTATHNQISDPITRARMCQLQIVILFRQWKHVFYFVA
jgi:hypothetical protein